jgi:hypothetical protein
MTNAEKKAAEVKAELSPLSKKEFEDLYNKAWDYGWVYGRFFQELYDEYLVNWVYFVDYLDVLKGLNENSRKYERRKINGTDYAIVEFKKDKNEKVVKPVLIEAKDFYPQLSKSIEYKENVTIVEILIGEAPPYWKGNADNKDKSYFYNPTQTRKSPWLNGPAYWKSPNNNFTTNETDPIKTKIEKLKLLAENKVVLIDFLPFPIIQDTKVRQNITGGFLYLLSNYFIDKYSEITRYINNSQETTICFEHGFVATTYTSMQFIFDYSIEGKAKIFRDLILKSPIKNVDVGELNFGEKDEMIITFKNKEKKSKNNDIKITFEITPLFNFIYELHTGSKYDSTKTDIDKTIQTLNEIGLEMKCPIFMVEGGSVNMKNNFFNSINDEVRESEIQKNFPDENEINNEIDEDDN